MFSSCFSLLSHLNSAVQVHSLQHFISDLFVPGHSTCMPISLTHVWLHPWTSPPTPSQKPTFPSPAYCAAEQQLSNILVGSAVLFLQPAWQSHGWWVTSGAPLSYFPHWPWCVSYLFTGVLDWGFWLLFLPSFWGGSYFCSLYVPFALSTHRALLSLILTALLSFTCQMAALPSLKMSLNNTLPLHQRLK